MKSGALDYIVKSSESMLDMPHIAERAIQQWTTLQAQDRMQKALAERQAQFRLLAENSSDMISRHDIRLWNDSCLSSSNNETAAAPASIPR